jgi:predicted RNase H-like HicB family nuclease
LVKALRSYSVRVEPELEGGYSVHVPAFRGAHTQGETVEEALANAREIIELYAEILSERGEPLPPSDPAGAVSITIPFDHDL